MKAIRVSIAATLIATAALSLGQTKTFQIVSDKLEYRNLATVENVSDFESFTGKTTKVSGTITFDPKKKTGSGIVIVDVASIDTGIPLRNDHMRSEGWMNAAKFPTVKFETTGGRNIGGNRYRVKGKLTLHGVTRDVQADVTFDYREAGEATRTAGFDGDVARLVAKLPIKLSDYGIILPAMVSGKVSNEVTIGISTYAVSK